MTLQYNKTTGKPYEGRNQAELLAVKKLRGYQSNEWLTFLQAKQLKLKIIKGSKGVAVFKGFQTMDTIELDKDNKKTVKTVSRPMGFAYVFNFDCTEPMQETTTLTPAQVIGSYCNI